MKKHEKKKTNNPFKTKIKKMLDNELNICPIYYQNEFRKSAIPIMTDFLNRTEDNIKKWNSVIVKLSVEAFVNYVKVNNINFIDIIDESNQNNINCFKSEAKRILDDLKHGCLLDKYDINDFILKYGYHPFYFTHNQKRYSNNTCKNLKNLPMVKESLRKFRSEVFGHDICNEYYTVNSDEFITLLIKAGGIDQFEQLKKKSVIEYLMQTAPGMTKGLCHFRDPNKSKLNSIEDFIHEVSEKFNLTLTYGNSKDSSANGLKDQLIMISRLESFMKYLHKNDKFELKHETIVMSINLLLSIFNSCIYNSKNRNILVKDIRQINDVLDNLRIKDRDHFAYYLREEFKAELSENIAKNDSLTNKSNNPAYLNVKDYIINELKKIEQEDGGGVFDQVLYSSDSIYTEHITNEAFEKLADEIDYNHSKDQKRDSNNDHFNDNLLAIINKAIINTIENDIYRSGSFLKETPIVIYKKDDAAILRLKNSTNKKKTINIESWVYNNYKNFDINISIIKEILCVNNILLEVGRKKYNVSDTGKLLSTNEISDRFFIPNESYKLSKQDSEIISKNLESTFLIQTIHKIKQDFLTIFRGLSSKDLAPDPSTLAIFFDYFQDNYEKELIYRFDTNTLSSQIIKSDINKDNKKGSLSEYFESLGNRKFSEVLNEKEKKISDMIVETFQEILDNENILYDYVKEKESKLKEIYCEILEKVESIDTVPTPF